MCVPQNPSLCCTYAQYGLYLLVLVVIQGQTACMQSSRGNLFSGFCLTQERTTCQLPATCLALYDSQNERRARNHTERKYSIEMNFGVPTGLQRVATAFVYKRYREMHHVSTPNVITHHSWPSAFLLLINIIRICAVAAYVIQHWMLVLSAAGLPGIVAEQGLSGQAHQVWHRGPLSGGSAGLLRG